MTNKSPYEQIEKLVEAGKKAYLGDKVQTEFDGGNCLSASDEYTQCDLTVLAMFNHIDFDRGQNKANADFFAQAANSRQAIEDMLNEHKRIEKIKSQVDVEALREALKWPTYEVIDGGLRGTAVQSKILEAAQTLLTLFEGEE